MSTNKTDLKEVMRNLNKRAGYSAVSFADELEERPRLPFKQKYLNDLTGGGVPCGLFTTIWGGESCGKSSVLLDLVATAQKNGKVCVYCDLEHSFDPKWAKKHGVDLTALVYGDFSTAEDPLDAVIAFCKAQAADLIIVDSVHGLSPKGEQEEKGGKERSVADDTMALVARKLSQFFRMAAGTVSSAKTAVVMVGQTRMDLGSFIKLEKLSGGHALLHWSSLIVQMRRGQKADAPVAEEVNDDGKKEKVIVGFNGVIKITKSKISDCCEGNEVSLPFYFGHGLTDGERPEATTPEEKPAVAESKVEEVTPVIKKRGRPAKGGISAK